ncbi:Uncharacterised protein [Bordetella pertussis]|nr:Uncharacterised protein [Bordetella pertussis]
MTTSTWRHWPLATRAAACMIMMQALAPPAWTAVQKPGWMPVYSQNTEPSIRCGSVNE